MCNGRMGYAKVLDLKSSSYTTNELDIILAGIVMWEHKNVIRDKIF